MSKPNGCSNTLTVKGVTQGLKIFKEYAKKENAVLSTEAFVPYPEKFKELDKIASAFETMRQTINFLAEKLPIAPNTEIMQKIIDARKKAVGLRVRDGYSQGGHKWCCDNWGDHLGICGPSLEWAAEGIFIYGFKSASSPVIPVIQVMAKMFPTLTFCLEYFDPGQNLAGKYVVKGEAILKDHRGKYPLEEKEDCPEGRRSCEESLIGSICQVPTA